MVHEVKTTDMGMGKGTREKVLPEKNNGGKNRCYWCIECRYIVAGKGEDTGNRILWILLYFLFAIQDGDCMARSSNHLSR
jgi:hypothetical protein